MPMRCRSADTDSELESHFPNFDSHCSIQTRSGEQITHPSPKPISPLIVPRLESMVFDQNPDTIHRYFKAMELFISQHQLDDKEACEWALLSVDDIDDYNLWKLSTRSCQTWREFKKAILHLYPEATSPKYTLEDLSKLMEEQEQKHYESMQDLGWYYRRFLLIYETLKEEGQILGDPKDFVEKFLKGLPYEFRLQLYKYLDDTRFWALDDEAAAHVIIDRVKEFYVASYYSSTELL